MKREIIVITSDGMDMAKLGESRSRIIRDPSADSYFCTKTTEEILQSTSFQGFPVVRSESDQTILGYIRKTELRFALG